MLNIGKSHWVYCAVHKTKWHIGDNLHSSWQLQTKDEQRATYDAMDFGAFTEVVPVFPEPDDPDDPDFIPF